MNDWPCWPRPSWPWTGVRCTSQSWGPEAGPRTRSSRQLFLQQRKRQSWQITSFERVSAMKEGYTENLTLTILTMCLTVYNPGQPKKIWHKNNYAKINRKIKSSSQPVYFNLKLSINSFLHSLPGGSAQDSERCTAQRTGRVPSLMEKTPQSRLAPGKRWDRIQLPENKAGLHRNRLTWPHIHDFGVRSVTAQLRHLERVIPATWKRKRNV